MSESLGQLKRSSVLFDLFSVWNMMLCLGQHVSHHYYANVINFSSYHVLPGWIAKRTYVYWHRHTGIIKPPSQPQNTTTWPTWTLYRSHVLLTPASPLSAKYRFQHNICSSGGERKRVTGSWMHFGRSSIY